MKEQAVEPRTALDTLSRYSGTVRTELSLMGKGAGALVALDVVIGALLVAEGVNVGGFPLNVFVLIALVALRITKKSPYVVPYGGLFIALLTLGLGFVTVSSFAVGISGTDQIIRRVGRMVIIIFFTLLIADRRVDFKSLMTGFGVGLVINATAFYLGLNPDNYGGYLTGWMEDKNVAGLFHGIVVLLLFGLYQQRKHRILILVIGLPLLWETGSRTSMAGTILGVLWILFAHRANLIAKIGIGFFLAWLFEYLQKNFADSEVFGDRTGTDWFREQIDILSWAKVEDAPWNGFGLGQAVVTFENGRTMYFHNSYWTLLVEGGWVWASLVCAATFLAVFVWKQPGYKTRRNLTAESAMVFLAVCSWRLGEVLLTVPWAFAVGYALSLTALPRISERYLRENRTLLKEQETHE